MSDVPRREAWLVGAAVVGLAAVSILVVAVLILGEPGAGPPVAVAPASLAELRGPWRAVPLVVHPAIASSADRACRADMPFPPGLQLVLIDARGAGVLEALYAGPGGQTGHCQQMVIEATGVVVAMGGGSHSAGPGPEFRQLQPGELESMGGFGSGGGPFGQRESSGVVGRLGAAIVQVVVLPPGQPPVAASVGNGWFAAWWPGPLAGAPQIVGYDAQGNELARVR